MAAAQQLLQKLAHSGEVRIKHVFLPPLPKAPAPFISIEAAQKMQMEDAIQTVAKQMKIAPLPTAPTGIPSHPPLPSISYEQYRRQKEANDKLVAFMKNGKA